MGRSIAAHIRSRLAALGRGGRRLSPQARRQSRVLVSTVGLSLAAAVAALALASVRRPAAPKRPPVRPAAVARPAPPAVEATLADASPQAVAPRPGR